MTPVDANAALAVDIIGANARMRDTLIMVFRGPAREACRLAAGDDAQAVIVNLDGVGASDEWARYRDRHPERPAIALSLNGSPVEHAAAVVAKPVRIDDLVAAVNAVKAALAGRAAATQRRGAAAITPAPTAAAAPDSRLRADPLRPPSAPPEQARRVAAAPAPCEAQGAADGARTLRYAPAPDEGLCGNVADIDIGDPAAVAAARCCVTDHLLMHVRAAVRESFAAAASMTVVVGGESVLTVSAQARCAFAHLPEMQLAAACARPAPDARIVRAEDPMTDGGVSLEALTWKLALWTYRGRLPEDAPVHERVYLRHWPNLTRLLPVPNALRVAALLVRQPMQLVRVAEVLRIPQRHVFAFYAAAAAIGLAGTARRSADALIAQVAPAPDERRPLLARIARHLPVQNEGHEQGGPS